MNVSKRVGIVAGLAALSLGLTACGGSGSSSSGSGGGKLTVYNAQ
ncbi:MAG: hypothetical protein JWN55_1481, partial [Frankiales bacterium]|nr:hypothetical protein [Frankiales bacterium]